MQHDELLLPALVNHQVHGAVRQLQHRARPPHALRRVGGLGVTLDVPQNLKSAIFFMVSG